MKFVWDEAKRLSNLRKHGLDFTDAARVFEGPMALFEDGRFNYGEQRLIGVGFLNELVVVIVHTESDADGEPFIRVISMRKADRDETNLYYQEAGL